MKKLPSKVAYFSFCLAVLVLPKSAWSAQTVENSHNFFNVSYTWKRGQKKCRRPLWPLASILCTYDNNHYSFRTYYIIGIKVIIFNRNIGTFELNSGGCKIGSDLNNVKNQLTFSSVIDGMCIWKKHIRYKSGVKRIKEPKEIDEK